MKWTVKLVAEVVDDKQIEHEIATIERADGISPATVGLTIAEGKGILESLQKEIVTAQVQQHGASTPSCPRCGRAYRTKGYYRVEVRILVKTSHSSTRPLQTDRWGVHKVVSTHTGDDWKLGNRV
jgi:hypothetical protein